MTIKTLEYIHKLLQENAEQATKKYEYTKKLYDDFCKQHDIMWTNKLSDLSEYDQGMYRTRKMLYDTAANDMYAADNALSDFINNEW